VGSIKNSGDLLEFERKSEKPSYLGYGLGKSPFLQKPVSKISSDSLPPKITKKSYFFVLFEIIF
jgi:hypothetical protein